MSMLPRTVSFEEWLSLIHKTDRQDAELTALRARVAGLVSRLLKAGDRLSFAAQTTGGTSGPDDELQEAIKGWQVAKSIARIERLEPEGISVAAVGGAARQALGGSDDQLSQDAR